MTCYGPAGSFFVGGNVERKNRGGVKITNEFESVCSWGEKNFVLRGKKTDTEWARNLATLVLSRPQQTARGGWWSIRSILLFRSSRRHASLGRTPILYPHRRVRDKVSRVRVSSCIYLASWSWKDSLILIISPLSRCSWSSSRLRHCQKHEPGKGEYRGEGGEGGQGGIKS